MLHLSSAKPNRCLYFVALLQPFARVFHAIVVVVNVCAGTKLYFLDRDCDLLFLRFVRLLFLFVLKLAEIDDAANRRLGRWSHFDEIHASVSSLANGVLDRHYAQLLAFFGDDAHLRHADPFINAHGRQSPVVRARATSKACSYCCTSSVRVPSFEFGVSS